MKKMLRAVIIEDECESSDLLIGLLKDNGNVEVCATTGDPNEAPGLISLHDPDIVFLDVKMPGKNGFEVLDDLQQAKMFKPYIVFTTAYDEFALRAFEYAAFDYLLKPVDPERLSATIGRCLLAGEESRKRSAGVLLEVSKKMIFKNINGFIIIDPKEVICVRSEGNYSVFHLINRKPETITIQLGKAEALLPEESFIRISRTFIINVNYLIRINTKKHECIIRHNGEEIVCDISKERMHILLDAFKGK